jgi:ribosomal protein L22
MSPDGPTGPPADGTPEDAPAQDAGEGTQAPAGTPAARSAGESGKAPAKRRRVRKAPKAERGPAGEQDAEPPSTPAAKDGEGEPAPPKRRAKKAPAAGAQAPDAGEAPAPASAPRRTPKAGGRPRRRVVRARARYVHTPARKARMVCVHLPGKSVAQARAILAFTPREVARDWSKLLESAVANAENNHELLEEDLVIREAYADEGPTIKRFRPRAMGRATPIRKRTSHLTITLTAGPETTKRAS